MTEITNLGAVHIGAGGPSGDSVVGRIDRDLAHRLNQLLYMANDLALAYGVAIRRLSSDALKREMADLSDSHSRFRTDLADFVRSLGATPAEKGDLHGLVERVRVVVGDLAGDSGILRAMATNEDEMAKALRVVHHLPGIPELPRALIAEAIRCELRHRDFYDRALKRFVG